MSDKLAPEIHIVDGKFVLVKKEIYKTLHPTEAGGLVRTKQAVDKTGTFDNKGPETSL